MINIISKHLLHMIIQGFVIVGNNNEMNTKSHLT
jgi:hypothetical protein